VRPDLIDLICCPVCKSNLDLKVTKENEIEILEGTLRCRKCNYDYPITEGIPNLLPPELQKE
jgi:uncharacterized protein YbaR (Trm112 family)